MTTVFLRDLTLHSINLQNYIYFIIGDVSEKILGFLVTLFGSGTKQTIGIRNRQVTPKERKKSLNKSSAATRRDSKTIVDFSAASNSSLTQQANQDNRTEILSLKDLNNSNECIDDELVPDDAVYQAPFGPSAGDKEENVSPADLERQLVSLTRELRHELLKEIHDDRTNRKNDDREMKNQMDEIRDEMRNQMDEIRDEMKTQNEKIIKQLTEIMQGAEKV